MKSEWVLKKLDDVCLIKGRIGYRGYTKQDLVEKGKGAISFSPSNIKPNKLLFNSCKYITTLIDHIVISIERSCQQWQLPTF